MIHLLPKVLRYHLFSLLGRPYTPPLNLTLSVTYRCFSRCRTCFVWGKEVEELTLSEYEKIFHSLGKGLEWVTISGGEPFLRSDIEEILRLLMKFCSPGIINIPTNGHLPGIPERVEKILGITGKARLNLNLSLDHIGEKHDEIRGLPGCWERMMGTFEGLKALNRKELSVGLATVISKYNAADLPDIWEEVVRLKPDSYVLEIAENRRELGTLEEEIAPSLDQYRTCVEFLVRKIKENPFSEKSFLTQKLRRYYYRLSFENLLRKKQVIPCRAGVASAHIAPDGDVWFCCVRAEPVGNLRESGYNFKSIWVGEKAAAERKRIRGGACFCPLANAAYTNMMMSPRALAEIFISPGGPGT